MRRIKEMTECEPAMRTAFISRKQPHENELTILPSFFILPLGLCRFFLMLLASNIALSLTPQKINSRHFFFLERFAIHNRTHEINLNPNSLMIKTALTITARKCITENIVM